MAESADELISSVLPQHLQAASVELAPYLVDSIGNSTRIDYGTGHETTFCALLCCLAKLGVLTKDDLQVPYLRRPPSASNAHHQSSLNQMRGVPTTVSCSSRAVNGCRQW